jgi:hypothetical protein
VFQFGDLFLQVVDLLLLSHPYPCQRFATETPEAKLDSNCDGTEW